MILIACQYRFEIVYPNAGNKRQKSLVSGSLNGAEQYGSTTPAALVVQVARTVKIYIRGKRGCMGLRC